MVCVDLGDHTFQDRRSLLRHLNVSRSRVDASFAGMLMPYSRSARLGVLNKPSFQIELSAKFCSKCFPVVF
ncbi:hypothetical protein A9K66_22820 [Mesorhizobium sp. AA23]|nr:hypothetical protein A9K66_22820 [Mesorhizobium sp. AA23]